MMYLSPTLQKLTAMESEDLIPGVTMCYPASDTWYLNFVYMLVRIKEHGDPKKFSLFERLT